MAYHRAHGLDTRIVRIFNTYGPPDAPGHGRVVPNFIGQALRGEALTIYGDVRRRAASSSSTISSKVSSACS